MRESQVLAGRRDDGRRDGGRRDLPVHRERAAAPRGVAGEGARRVSRIDLPAIKLPARRRRGQSSTAVAGGRATADRPPWRAGGGRVRAAPQPRAPPARPATPAAAAAPAGGCAAGQAPAAADAAARAGPKRRDDGAGAAPRSPRRTLPRRRRQAENGRRVADESLRSSAPEAGRRQATPPGARRAGCAPGVLRPADRRARPPGVPAPMRAACRRAPAADGVTAPADRRSRAAAGAPGPGVRPRRRRAGRAPEAPRERGRPAPVDRTVGCRRRPPGRRGADLGVQQCGGARAGRQPEPRARLARGSRTSMPAGSTRGSWAC